MLISKNILEVENGNLISSGCESVGYCINSDNPSYKFHLDSIVIV